MTASPRHLDFGVRAMARLAALARFTDEPGRLTRFYLSPAHRLAADAVAVMLREAGCDSVRIDALGTVVGRYEARIPDAPALLIGSHIDTVRDAGAYDGNLGVVAGIGVIEALAQAGERGSVAIEVLAFGDEENVRFPTHLSSSRALAGRFDPASMSLCDADGVSFRDALIAFGGDPAAVADLARQAGSARAYVEVHIEQGPVLEAEGLPLGVVTAINGASRCRVSVLGMAGHAGTVPMNRRRDALAGAAEMTLAIEARAAEYPDAVATVGRLIAEPGAPNVIPGRVVFTLDARAPLDAVRLALVEAITADIKRIAARRGLDVTIEEVSATPACPCEPAMIAALAESIRRQGMRALALPSGAGHDAMAMADLCPVGMLFVRCAGGGSHNPAEAITAADADIAIRVLHDFTRAFARIA